MTSETNLAFAALDTRAQAMSVDPAADRISLRDYLVGADIGAFQQERGEEQRLRFNVVVELRPHRGPLEDDVDRILSYDKITDAIAKVLAIERLNLLETLAEQVAERLLLEPQALRVFVRVEKMDRGPGALGVEIVRSLAANAPVADTGSARVAPTVIYLSNDEIAAPGLTARLDALRTKGVPLVLAVGRPDLPVPVGIDAEARRRIDLLAIEQAAWALAARVSGCTVAATRTEIDWAVSQGADEAGTGCSFGGTGRSLRTGPCALVGGAAWGQKPGRSRTGFVAGRNPRSDRTRLIAALAKPMGFLLKLSA